MQISNKMKLHCNFIISAVFKPCEWWFMGLSILFSCLFYCTFNIKVQCLGVVG